MARKNGGNKNGNYQEGDYQEGGLDANSIDEILQKTVDNIKHGKEEIFEIAESSRTEYQQQEKELATVKKQVAETIEEVDQLEKKYQRARINLAQVSKFFNTYSEEDIKDAYEQASELKARLTIVKDREQQLRRLRDNIERRLRNLKNSIERAENVMNQMGIIESYLSQSHGGLQETLDSLEKRKNLGVKIIKAQEEERRRVAREIHDGPAQSLANMVLNTEYCEKLLENDKDPQVIQSELANLKEQARLNLKDVRRIIFDLRPMTLDDLGLVPAIRRLIQQLDDDTGISGELTVFGDERRLNREVEIAMFRTVQEAVQNIKKHSGARYFWVKAEFKDEFVLITVRDDGRGFDVDEINKQSNGDHFGISNMKDRIESIGGEFNINSQKKKGTWISIKAPSTDDDN